MFFFWLLLFVLTQKVTKKVKKVQCGASHASPHKSQRTPAELSGQRTKNQMFTK